MISTYSFCLYFVFQFENNMSYYMCYYIITGIFLIVRASPDLPYDQMTALYKPIDYFQIT